MLGDLGEFNLAQGLEINEFLKRFQTFLNQNKFRYNSFNLRIYFWVSIILICIIDPITMNSGHPIMYLMHVLLK